MKFLKELWNEMCCPLVIVAALFIAVFLFSQYMRDL